ncbi:hypothetical protein BC629DRAFT_1587185 [Irpex lacteus]|nr:hypothetical protein BC629DRAFT_1587185 [Irpex lacteus]
MPPKQSKPRQKKASKQKAKGRSTQTAPAVPQLPNRKNAPEVEPDNSIQLELQPNTPSTPLHAQFYAVLHQAREEARKDKEWQYSWAKTRQQMEDNVKDRTDGKILRYYQGDVGEAFALGLDSVFLHSLLRLILAGKLNRIARDCQQDMNVRDKRETSFSERPGMTYERPRKYTRRPALSAVCCLFLNADKSS